MADVCDFVIMVRNEFGKIQKEADHHPSDTNGFWAGVLTGLKLGQTSVWCGNNFDEKLLDVLAAGPEKTLAEILIEANKFMRPDIQFKPGMYENAGYRTGHSSRCYQEGIRLGYTYAFDLLSGLDDHSRDFVVSYIPVIRENLFTQL